MFHEAAVGCDLYTTCNQPSVEVEVLGHALPAAQGVTMVHPYPEARLCRYKSTAGIRWKFRCTSLHSLPQVSGKKCLRRCWSDTRQPSIRYNYRVYLPRPSWFISDVYRTRTRPKSQLTPARLFSTVHHFLCAVKIINNPRNYKWFVPELGWRCGLVVS